MVMPDDAESGDFASERDDVPHDVCGASETVGLLCDLDDRHRRFGRDPADLAPCIGVKHQVADDGNSFSIDQSRTDCLITLHPKFIPFQVSNALQKEILVYLQSNPGIRCEDDQEAITLAQAGYGIAILPGFCLPPDGLPGLTVMPVQAGKEIDYGFVYAKRTPHIKLFEAEYTAHQAP